MTLPSIGAVGLGINPPRTADSPEKIKDAASQFEALLIGEILKASRGDSEEGSFGGGSDPASASAMDFANDYFARAMASKGGLGLTKLIVGGLERQSAKAQNHVATESEQPKVAD